MGGASPLGGSPAGPDSDAPATKSGKEAVCGGDITAGRLAGRLLVWEEKEALAGLGNWGLICCFEIASAWPEPADEHWGMACALAVFVAAAVLLFTQCRRPSASGTIQLQQRPWALAAHVTLVAGCVLWLVLHVAAGGRSPQVCAGTATLWSLLSLSMVRGWTRPVGYQAPCGAASLSSAEEGTARQNEDGGGRSAEKAPLHTPAYEPVVTRPKSPPKSPEADQVRPSVSGERWAAIFPTASQSDPYVAPMGRHGSGLSEPERPITIGISSLERNDSVISKPEVVQPFPPCEPPDLMLVCSKTTSINSKPISQTAATPHHNPLVNAGGNPAEDEVTVKLAGRKGGLQSDRSDKDSPGSKGLEESAPPSVPAASSSDTGIYAHGGDAAGGGQEPEIFLNKAVSSDASEGYGAGRSREEEDFLLAELENANAEASEAPLLAVDYQSETPHRESQGSKGSAVGDLPGDRHAAKTMSIPAVALQAPENPESLMALLVADLETSLEEYERPVIPVSRPCSEATPADSQSSEVGSNDTPVVKTVRSAPPVARGESLSLVLPKSLSRKGLSRQGTVVQAAREDSDEEEEEEGSPAAVEIKDKPDDDDPPMLLSQGFDPLKGCVLPGADFEVREEQAKAEEPDAEAFPIQAEPLRLATLANIHRRAVKIGDFIGGGRIEELDDALHLPEDDVWLQDIKNNPFASLMPQKPYDSDSDDDKELPPGFEMDGQGCEQFQQMREQMQNGGNAAMQGMIPMLLNSVMNSRQTSRRGSAVPNAVGQSDKQSAPGVPRNKKIGGSKQASAANSARNSRSNSFCVPAGGISPMPQSGSKQGSRQGSRRNSRRQSRMLNDGENDGENDGAKTDTPIGNALKRHTLGAATASSLLLPGSGGGRALVQFSNSTQASPCASPGPGEDPDDDEQMETNTRIGKRMTAPVLSVPGKRHSLPATRLSPQMLSDDCPSGVSSAQTTPLTSPQGARQGILSDFSEKSDSNQDKSDKAADGASDATEGNDKDEEASGEQQSKSEELPFCMPCGVDSQIAEQLTALQEASKGVQDDVEQPAPQIKARYSLALPGVETALYSVPVEAETIKEEADDMVSTRARIDADEKLRSALSEQPKDMNLQDFLARSSIAGDLTQLSIGDLLRVVGGASGKGGGSGGSSSSGSSGSRSGSASEDSDEYSDGSDEGPDGRPQFSGDLMKGLAEELNMDVGSISEALKLLMMMNTGFKQSHCTCKEGGPHTCMSPAVSNIASQVHSTLASMSHSLAGSKAASKSATRRGSLGKGEKADRRQSADRRASAGRRHSQKEEAVSPSPSGDPLDDAARATAEAERRDKKRHSSHDKKEDDKKRHSSHHGRRRSGENSSSSHHRNSAPHALDSPRNHSPSPGPSRQLSPGASRPDSPGEAHKKDGDGSPTGRSPAHSADPNGASPQPRSPTSASPTPGSGATRSSQLGLGHRSSLLGSRGCRASAGHVSFGGGGVDADAGAGPSKPVVVDVPATPAAAAAEAAPAAAPLPK